MADKERSKLPRAQTTPEDIPVSSPHSGPPSGDYSYTVELVGAIQHQLGKLTEAVETLKGLSKEHGQKLERISHTIYAATAVVTVIGALALFILNKIWDAALLYFKPH